MLLHILGHVEAYHCPGIAEDRVGQRPAQLGLAHAGGAAEEERAYGSRRILEPHPSPADGAGHGGDCLILPDDALLQSILQRDQALALALGKPRHRNARPDRQHLSHVCLCHVYPALYPHGGSGLVQKVDGLVRQKTVADITHRERTGGLHGGVGKTDAVMLFQRRAQ